MFSPKLYTLQIKEGHFPAGSSVLVNTIKQEVEPAISSVHHTMMSGKILRKSEDNCSLNQYSNIFDVLD